MNEQLTDHDVTDVLQGLEALLAAEAEPTVPTATPTADGAVTGRPAAQGDLLFLPTDDRIPHWAQPIIGPVPLVREGNGHRVVPTGDVRYAAVQGDRHLIAFLTVGPGARARIEQPRGADAHDALVLGPGTWQVRRQAEQVAPNVIRRVID